MRETDTGKWILDRSNIQSVYLGGRFLAWPLEDEGRGVSVSVTKPAHPITGGSKSSVHQNRPRPRANGQRNEIQSIDSTCRRVELSVAQMGQPNGYSGCRRHFCSAYRENCNGHDHTRYHTTDHREEYERYAYRSNLCFRLERELARSVAVPSLDCDTDRKPDTLGRNLLSRNEPVPTPRLLNMSDRRPQKMASRA